ncbi:GNAT family N-acetyltransferase, partial [Plesiomonas shigelloides]
YENKSIGKTLLYLVIDYFKNSGFKRVFLSCSPDPQSRSYGFYRHLGWSFTGLYDDADDEILEYATAI